MAGPYIDLHTHSMASDGSDTPSELVRKAAEANVTALALTDHDTMDGLDEAGAEAKRLGVYFIRGIEIAVQDEHGELHLVGLWMPQPSRRMRSALHELEHNRLIRNQVMLDSLTALGMPLSMEEVRAVAGGRSVGRPHIAAALKNKGYVSSRREAFSTYIGWSGKAYVPRVLATPREGIGLLRDEGATVALAHPMLSKMMTPERLDDTLSDFRSYGLEAIEAYHSSHDAQSTRICVELGARHNLLLSGGSDYHGNNKENITLGRGAGALRVPFFVLEKLQAQRKNKGLWI